VTQAQPAVFKIPAKIPQLVPDRVAKPPVARRTARGKKAYGVSRSPVFASGNGRAATRGGGEVIELEHGITVYPPRDERGRWRAVWHEAGTREQCEAATEERLSAKLEKVKARLAADAPNMKKTGADLIAHYLDPDRMPVSARWSRKHAHTQQRLCARFAAPVIASVACQDIKAEHTQAIVNAAPTAGEGDRVRGMISALVTAGLDGGYLANPRLAKVHWQAGERSLPAPAVSMAGESVLWVDPGEIPSDDDIARLGQALAAGRRGERDELMANAAAYSGLRWGELTALTIPQVSADTRVITVDRKVVEVAGHLYVEAPKNRKYRRTIYPRRTPGGYPLAEKLEALAGRFSSVPSCVALSRCSPRERPIKTPATSKARFHGLRARRGGQQDAAEDSDCAGDAGRLRDLLEGIASRAGRA
jgi:integrase